jgi:hypothetical protein
MELLTAFDRAVASTADVVKATPAGRLSARTPCTEWDVRALLNHVIGTLWLAEALFSDQDPRYPMVPGGQPADLDGRLAAHVLGFAEQAITPETRAPRIGPRLPVAADAPVTQRLAAFLGRNP